MTVTTAAPESPQLQPASQKLETFKAPAAKWGQAILGLLLMSLFGLKFYPALALILLFFFWRYRTDRYSLFVELIIFIDGSGLMPYDLMPLKVADLGLLMGIIGIFIYRKDTTIRRICYAMLTYFAILFMIALTSLESMSIQIIMMRNYWLIILFFVPLLVFANRSFEWNKFMNALVVHMLVLCGFYAVDTFIFNGFILLPETGFCIVSTFIEPVFQPFMSIPRHYPRGLFWMVPCVLALNYNKLRFSKWQWCLIVLSLISSRTSSFLFALVVCVIFMRPNLKKALKIAVICVIALAVMYGVDKATGGFMRVESTIDQFTSLDSAKDEQDLAEFGTGRMAQIIPKWLLLTEMDRNWLGFGFLHRTKTTREEFQIYNNLYVNPDLADEVSTGVEVGVVQTIFDCGYLGLIAQCIFYIGLYFIIRHLKHSKYYLCTLIGVSVISIGGYANLNSIHGLSLLAMVLGAILCANKPLSLKPLMNEKQ